MIKGYLSVAQGILVIYVLKVHAYWGEHSTITLEKNGSTIQMVLWV